MQEPGLRNLESTLRQRIGEDELSFTFARSSGPGGQNVNKTNTRATLWFDLRGTTSLSAEEKRTVLEKLRGRINAEGCLHISVMRHRTQLANRNSADVRFFELLAWALLPRTPRRATKMPRASKEQRLRAKRQRAERKHGRSPRPANDFGD